MKKSCTAHYPDSNSVEMPFPVRSGIPWAASGLCCIERRTSCKSRLPTSAELAIPSLLALAAAVAYQNRPRGWANHELIEVRESATHGLGVFARAPIAAKTVIGAYPGFLRGRVEMESKLSRYPAVEGYVYGVDDYGYLDPTDEQGGATDRKLWGVASTSMAFVNEPSLSSGGRNTTFEDGSDPLDILFVTERDVASDEELLIDYGTRYNRTDYK